MPALRLALAFLLAFSAPALAEEMRAGKWRITMHGTEGAAGDEETFASTQCMTAEDLDSQVMAPAGEMNVPAGSGDYETSAEDGDCSYRVRRKGNALHVQANCSGEVTTSDITYGADSFTLKSTLESEGETSEITMEGKRLGDC